MEVGKSIGVKVGKHARDTNDNVFKESGIMYFEIRRPWSLTTEKVAECLDSILNSVKFVI